MLRFYVPLQNYTRRALRNTKNWEIDFIERELIPQGGIRMSPAVLRLRDFRFAPRSETLQGRKKFMSANEVNFQSSELIIHKEITNGL
jgi:hypothetical protein